MPKRISSSRKRPVKPQAKTKEMPKAQSRAKHIVRKSAIAGAARAKKIFHIRPRKDPLRRSDTGTRLLQVPEQIWYLPLTWRHRRPVPDYTPLPKARALFWSVLMLLWKHKALFGVIVLIYGISDAVLAKGLSNGGDLSSLKSSLESVAHGVGGKLLTSGVSFTYLLANSGSSASSSSGYVVVLLTLCSLAFIWAFRQVLVGNKVRARDSFYQGMYPLIPFLLLFLLMSVQMLPLVAGGGLYAVIVAGGIAVHLWEKIFWVVFCILPAVWSLRMVTATIFAIYIVTLPNMTPLRAYRSARELVYGRRLLIWRKLIFLPVVLLLLAALIEIPLILFATPIARWSFFVISMISLPVVHGYLYRLYREML
jgi:hypothetical protein